MQRKNRVSKASPITPVTTKPLSVPPKSAETKTSKILTRVKYGLFLVGVAALAIYLGHLPLILLMVVCQMFGFREMVNVRYEARVSKEVPFVRTIQWCWFGAFMFYFYGKTFSKFQLRGGQPDNGAQQYYRWISLCMYLAAFVTSTLSLRRKYLKYQIGQFAWTALSILLVVLQLGAAVKNVLNGIFWFLLPLCLVTLNDSFAYIFGLPLGKKFIKRNLTALSPNKSWEGFIGAFFATTCLGFLVPLLFTPSPWLTCAPQELPVWDLACDTPPVFLPAVYAVPAWLAPLLGSSVTLLPVQLHAAVLGVLASLVGPFGGFFASGVKRAYDLKDFGDLIPGHGGVVDRMDCQMLMAAVTYIYFVTFIDLGVPSLQQVLFQAKQLSLEDQQSLLAALQ